MGGWSSGLRKSYHFPGLGLVDDDDVVWFGLSGVVDEVEMMEEAEEEGWGIEVLVLVEGCRW